MQEALPRVEFAPAKVNLALHVVGRRDDGYHLLESLAVFTRFGDRIEIEEADEDSFVVSGPFAEGVPTDETNLVVGARDALRAALPHASARVSIMLQKNLPPASGIGGGSSDAAATLRGLAKLWELDAGNERLSAIGAALGADLPMCIEAKPLIARGTGEQLSPVAGFPSLGLVLVNPGVAVSTPAVFSALKRRDNEALPALPTRIDFHTLRNWLEMTRNDLEEAALSIEPAIGAAKRALENADAGFARMSGSGATCFGLFETGNVAKRAAAVIRKRHPDWFVAATRTMPSEDAHEQD
ncbi:4-(cytidine 5'-diphospho)-2-C-methyl-D-erythritol kinase [Mesorhizobium sp. VNQ89]|uniref:4-(cytidine 5'-diphospho)-2-C-methyl-D-erythritol kinase n=1 Tax=Mesorhizobium quangtriensis TaxID=3157709 RepID=UPI0032B750F4